MPLVGTMDTKWPVIRDILAFGLGSYGVITQLQAQVKDPIILAFCAGLMGVPAMLGVTKKDSK